LPEKFFFIFHFTKFYFENSDLRDMSRGKLHVQPRRVRVLRRTGTNRGTNDQLVPYVPRDLTDRTQMPRQAETTFSCIKTYVSTGVIVQANATPVFYLPVFTFNLIGDYSSLAAVFDQYKINMIEFILTPRLQDPGLTGSAVGYSYVVLDYDDASTPGSIPALTSYSNCITSSVAHPVRRCFRPRIAVAAYGAGAFTSYKNEAAGWIDMSSTAVPHFGVKCGVDPYLTGTPQVFDSTTRFHVSCRASR
jgi:hypothetical protein